MNFEEYEIKHAKDAYISCPKCGYHDAVQYYNRNYELGPDKERKYYAYNSYVIFVII